MALPDERTEPSEGSKVCKLCRIPFWQAGASSSSSSAAAVSRRYISHRRDARAAERSDTQYPTTSRGGGGRGSVSSVAKSPPLPVRRRLRLDPSSKLYFPYEPGKQVRSAVRIKNTSKSHVAFKFQTTLPKSCFTRPPGAILSPGESIPSYFRCCIIWLICWTMLKQLDKLKRLLAEADAAVEARKKLPEDTGPKILGEGLVIDEWKEHRERYLVWQQVELVDSI